MNDSRSLGGGTTLKQTTALEGDFDCWEYTFPHPAAGRGWLSDSQRWSRRGSAAGLPRKKKLVVERKWLLRQHDPVLTVETVASR